MLKKLFDKYVPLAILPRRTRIENIVGTVFQGQMKQDLLPWCLKNGMTEREYNIFIDVVVEKLGDQFDSSDPDAMIHAGQDAIIELLEYVARKSP